ncbi:MAG: M1 family metallopeptidase [Flavobacteriales bacterium]|nr:M1 family metallopeptidase [Flavobacteriales bacterium]
MKKFFLTTTALFIAAAISAQSASWQQRAEYKMDVELNDVNHQYKGKQTLTYYNNSPESLNKVFFHLYFNAFQPGSAMDVRSRTIVDPDGRVGDRIFNLKPEEYGYLHVKSLKIDGRTLKTLESETILEVTLDKPIAAGTKAVFELEFEGQVPLQIRRSGRDNNEGIDYSMSQWYPKMCEYDAHGWHANPYIGREFYGVWGDFDVNITMAKNYIIAATGVLQNPNEIGYGYADDETKVKKSAGEKLTWRFKAQNVHDFVWAADPDYAHDKIQVPDGPMLHFFYQKNTDYVQSWKDAQPLMTKAFDFLSKNFGKYPYPVYSIIQGGDGGMEYPMATLVTGNRKLPSLVGVSVHEAAHSWYQGVLATNESLYAWMDEGFTSFASQETMDYLFRSGMPTGHEPAYNSYIDIVKEGKEESLDTHADHFETNYAYGTAVYSKGEVYLAQLEYIIGPYHFRTALLNYFNTFKFKHPDNYDFIRTMEKQSGMELDWYNEYFVNTTKTIDYSIAGVMGEQKQTKVVIERKGLMPMPLDVEVKYKDGTFETFVIALDIMRGEKPADGYNGKWTIMPDWKWVEPVYELMIPKGITDIESITIDSSGLMADINRKNNTIVPANAVQFIIDNR